MQEKNRNTLLHALRQLPEHQPPDLVWQEITNDLDRFQSEKPLRRALSDLPDHEPPADLWQQIDGQLTAATSEQTLHDAIAELPTYEAPDLIWEAIETELEGEQQPPVREIRVIPLWRRPAVAASLTALFCALAWLLLPSSSESVSMAYRTVEVEKLEFGDDEASRDEAAFELVLHELDQQLALAEDPYLTELKRELDDLDLAKRQIQEAMGAYGQDESLVQQITHIEHERSAVLKEMVEKI